MAFVTESVGELGGPPQEREPGSSARHGLSKAASSTLMLYGLLTGFLLLVAAMGMVGLSAARTVFIVGGAGLAYHAYKTGGLAAHVEVVIVMFVLGPFLRRLIDLHAGFDASGTMLVGPLVAIAVVLPELRSLLDPNRSAKMLIPYMLMTACLVYGWAISAFQNNVIDSTIVGIKYMIPMLYAVCLISRPDESDAVLQAAARAFLVLGPIIGLYGVLQHLSPQAWDQYWMVEAKMPSIGQPFPGQVRVFSTMNSPVSFAAYATCGLLLFSFMPRSFIPPILVPVVAILPLCLAILLTSVRTAWISAGVSILFCLLFNRTRGRATFLIICLGLGITFALLFTSFADVISDRFASLDTNVDGDGSGHERMGDYLHVFSEDSRYIFGTGMAPVVGDQNMAALDGQILSSAVQMGTTFGMLYILGVVWAGVQAVLRIGRNEEPIRLVAAALIIGNLVILPLTSIAVGEIGFLYWIMVGVLSSRRITSAPSTDNAAT